MSKPRFTGEEIIADVLLEFPEAHEILAMHGIACAGCHINQYESLREGIIAHYGDSMFDIVMKDLNQAVMDTKSYLTKDPIITDIARDKILQFQKDSQQIGYGFRIEITTLRDEVSYFLDFEKTPKKEDRVIECNGINVFCDEDSFKFLQNKKIDYQVTETDEGFKFI